MQTEGLQLDAGSHGPLEDIDDRPGPGGPFFVVGLSLARALFSTTLETLFFLAVAPPRTLGLACIGASFWELWNWLIMDIVAWPKARFPHREALQILTRPSYNILNPRSSCCLTVKQLFVLRFCKMFHNAVH